jgi:branched-chain amino acid transport system ATP-binding protein
VSASSPAALETRGLNRRFGGLVATDNVWLTLMPGARHALIGPNGAGKTTFVNLLTGVLAPSSGAVFLNGEEVTRQTKSARVRKGLTRTFQISRLFGSLTPREALTLAACEAAGDGGVFWRALPAHAKAGRRADELMAHFNLLDEADRPTRTLA